MRIDRFYTTTELAENKEIILNEEISHHLIKVLRMKINFQLVLFNGDSFDYLCKIIEINKHIVKVLVISKTYNNNESSLNITLAQVVGKNDKMDFVVQKASELGANKIYPLISDFSEKQQIDDKKINRWQTISENASCQAQRAKICQIENLMTFSDFLTLDFNEYDAKFILHPHNSQKLNHSLQMQKICFIVGPEGGFSENELNLAKQSGFQQIAFGNRILRTETAALTALSILQYQFGDLR